MMTPLHYSIFTAAALLTPHIIHAQIKENTPEQITTWAHSIQPTKKNKIKDIQNPRQYTQKIQEYINLPAQHLTPHPTAATFPGHVPKNATRITQDVSIDLNRPRWAVTGLYNAPGEPITIKIPETLTNKGLKLIIGSHTDNVTRRASLTGIKRFPILSRTIPLNKSEITLGNPFGGAIYIDVPANNDALLNIRCFGYIIAPYATPPAKNLVNINISGAVEAPRWNPQMTQEQWAQELKKPAPWTELEFGNLNASIPTPLAAKNKNLHALAKHWNTVLNSQWKLGGYPGIRHIPQRISFDLQISAGFMHSGYPVQAPLNSIDLFLDHQKISTSGSWGIYHEFGHNHQPIVITPDGYTETTVNIFSIFGYLATHPDTEYTSFHPAIKNGKWIEKYQDRINGKAGHWENLSTYIATMKKFGPESFQKTFTTLWKMPSHGSFRMNRGKGTNIERQNQWVKTYSTTVQRDLSDYFQKHGFTITQDTRKSLSTLKKWNPTIQEIKKL